MTPSTTGTEGLGLEHPHLERLAADVQAVTREARALFQRLSDAQLIWKPEPTTWNVLECFEHLTLLDGLYLPKLRAAVQDARARGALGYEPYEPGWFARWFINRLRPGTRKVKTLQMFKPPTNLRDLAARDRFLSHQDALLDVIHQADGVRLNGRKLFSPASRLVRFTIGEALTMLVVHQQRHLLQAQRLTQRPNFPSA